MLSRLLWCVCFVTVLGFERFSSDASSHTDLMREYSAWHGKQIEHADCKDKLSIVWKPEAGIGDAAFSLCQAFGFAIMTGRLFFVDWTMTLSKGDGARTMSWSKVLTPPFAWDFAEARSSGAICSEQSGNADATLHVIDMDVQDGKWDLVQAEIKPRELATAYGGLPILTDIAEAHMIRFLLKPSADLQARIGGLQEILNNNFMVSMAIRTGVIEDRDTTFLSKCS